MYQPRRLGEPAGSVAADLAAHAWNRRLTLYAGAGVSAASPTSLPGAAALAHLVFDALRGQIPLDGVDANDLVAVADAIETQPLGADLLRQTILRVADLRGAAVNYAHEVLGLLLCEGAATVIETNYDDCIERAAQPERPVVVRTGPEMLQASGAALLKAHGCATQTETMRVSQADLDSVPQWAQTRIAAQLRNDRVVFIGIGSPADYVRNTITALLAEVGPDHLLVVDPWLAEWDAVPAPAWRTILPHLPPEQRDHRTAEAFCDALLRGYLGQIRTTARNAVAGMPEGHPQRRGLERIIKAMEQRDAVWALRWMRAGSYKLSPGVSVVTSPVAVAGLLGTGCLLGDAGLASLRPGGWLFVTPTAVRPQTGAQQATPEQLREPAPLPNKNAGVAPTSNSVDPTPIMLLMTHGPTLGAAAEAEARRRVVQARGGGVVAPGADVVVVVVGHMGPMSTEVKVARGDRLAIVVSHRPQPLADDPPENLIADVEPSHLIDGVNSGRVLLVNGDDLIEAA